MNTEKYTRWLTLAANVGVIGGLLLVAVQINQNTEITKAQLANDYYIADMQLELSMMGDNPAKSWVKAVYSSGELTQEDAAVVDRYFNYGIVQILRLLKMRELGLADEDWVKNRISYLDWHLGNEVGQRWWTFSKKTYAKDFVQMIDDDLAQSDYRSNRDLLDAMMLESEAERN
jgi:hypothetical protein